MAVSPDVRSATWGTPRAGRALWASTSLATPGGMTTFVRLMLGTPLATAWTIELLPTHRPGSVLTRLLVFARALARYLWLMVSARPDVVHLHTAKNASVVRKGILLWLAAAWGVPVVLHVHGGKFTAFYRRVPRPARWAVRRTLRRASVVVALGEHWAAELRAIEPGARVVAIPNGVRIHGPAHRDPSGPVHVVFLGKIGAEKGAFTLLEAWEALLAGPEPPAARLTVAGNGEVGAARDMVARLGLAGTVQVRSWLAPDEAAALLDGADVLTLPSRYEGQPMAVLEAMARGLAVVATPVGSIPELLTDGVSGLLVPVDDVDALAAALRRVIVDGEVRVRFGDAALANARERYDLDVAWRRIDGLYRELVRPAGRAAGRRSARPAG